MAPEPGRRWRIWIDTGGTFTDCLARDPYGRLRRAKVLSTGAVWGRVTAVAGAGQLIVEPLGRLSSGLFDGCPMRRAGAAEPTARVAGYEPSRNLLRLEELVPTAWAPGDRFEIDAGEEAPVLAARMVTRTPRGEQLPALEMRLATTRGTNALLERRGAPTVLFITRGFADLLEIGTQQRPELFALAVRKPRPLYERVVEVDERLDAGGRELRAIDTGKLDEAVTKLRAQGYEAAAVALLHSYRNPEHEVRLADFLRARGFRHVACSSSLVPQIRLLPRAETAVADAYLGPVVGDYLERVRRPVEAVRLHVMTSAGGLQRAGAYRPKDSLLSGPAGGVVGAAAAGRSVGLERVIAFDMGGTSTDVSRYDREFDYRFETEVGGIRLLAPALAIETVAAGGGSVCRFEAERFQVGPQSAGASPGPACYGGGGPLCLTDVNLLLGRLWPHRFGLPIDSAAATSAAELLLSEAGTAAGEREETLAGLLQIANERMAEAVRQISIRRGYDPSEYALVAFGGAGPQHACALADLLGMTEVVVPPDASLLSALGLGAARIERFTQRQVLEPLKAVEERLDDWVEELAARAVDEVAAEGVPRSRIEVRLRQAELRLLGQDASLAVEFGRAGELERAFHRAYRKQYGYPAPPRGVEVDLLRVAASSRVSAARRPRRARARRQPPRPAAAGSCWFAAGWLQVPVYDRGALGPGERFEGPALVVEDHTCTVVEPRWEGRVEAGGALRLSLPPRQRRVTEKRPGRGTGTAPGAVSLELFANRFGSIVEQMGAMLRRTALSVNVKERLDFSCALLDGAGYLVVNAPHIPVHLGALGLCVRRVMERCAVGPGDVLVTNHPAFGGSHLPDVTVITPVFRQSGESVPIGWLASRAHHAEIGGTRPGSMPPGARTLAEEGVVIAPRFLVRRGRARWGAMRRLLETGPYPSRAVEENLADLSAAVAANQLGVTELRRLLRRHGEQSVTRHFEGLASQAENRLAELLRELGEGRFEAVEQLDDGTPLRVEIQVADGRAKIDFQGSSAVHAGNLNATPAIVTSTVLYVLRLLIQRPMPLNEGLLRRVELRIPPGILNPAFPDDPSAAPAVVGGNVETSQRLVDTLLKALAPVACSQGTMNNLLFGTSRASYYETVCGGCGAGPGFDGASAVHSHMTNTAITDPEILELRYPVRLESFAIRRGSGGSGRYRGGDGVVRALRFLEPVRLSVLSQHRREGPYGMAGGRPGAPGAQWIETTAGVRRPLAAMDSRDLEAGDRLVLETPGGGGWGSENEE